MNQTGIVQFLPTTLVDWVDIAAGVATVIVIIFLYLQMRSTDQSNKLAYGPLVIARRTLVEGGGIVLNLVNIGNGSAKEILYKVTDMVNYEDLIDGKTIPFIKAGDERTLQIAWKAGRKVWVTAIYEDVIGGKHNFKDEIMF